MSESEVWLKTNHARWLESPDDGIKQLIDNVSELLSDGLLPHGMRISRITVDNVFVNDGHGVELPMRDISDGCRGMYATILDLVHSMWAVYGAETLFGSSPGAMIAVTPPGVVLIDELEAHLHPSWQRDLPEWLKLHFPNIQFLVTTHSPLVAQASDRNGIFVLPSPSDADRRPRMLEEEEAKKIRLGRAEKTLLGAAFGLTHVRSQWANEQIQRWQQLDAKKKGGGALTTKETNEYTQLRGDMETAFDLPRELDIT